MLNYINSQKTDCFLRRRRNVTGGFMYMQCMWVETKKDSETKKKQKLPLFARNWQDDSKAPYYIN